MKKLYPLSFILMTSLSFGQFTDSFTGTGPLSDNGWAVHSGTGPLLISAGSLTYTGIASTGNKVAMVAGNGQDVNKSVGTPIETIAYFSTVLNLPNTTGLNTTGDFCMHLGGTKGAAVTGFFGRLFLKTGAAANTFKIGIQNTSGGTGQVTTYLATDYPTGTPVFVVVKYVKANSTASLWVNPALDVVEPAADLTNATGTFTPTNIESLVFRQVGSNAIGSGNVEFDDVRVADNWAYVASSIAPTTTWNGTTWSNGNPSESKEAIIDGTYTTTANGPFTAKKLTVNTSKSLVINTGTNVTVQNEVINNGSLVVENNANLIQVNNVANTGAITVKRESNPLFRLDYTMWSSPTGISQTMSNFSPLTSSGRFYEYNTGTNLYNAIGDAIPFSKGKGFLIRMPNEDPANLGGGSPYSLGSAAITYNGVFTGIPNNGDVSVAGTAGLFVAVGNPYPSNIIADDFINANTDTPNTGVLYFWRKTNGIGATAYATITKAGGAGIPGANDGFIPNGNIAVGQGFITTAPTLGIKFTNSMRTNNAANFLRTKAVVQKDRVWINLLAGANPVNQMLVAYMDGATTGVDAGIDGKYINDAATALTSDINNEEYVIQGRPAFSDSDIVNLNFKTNVAGDFTIAKDHVDGLFATAQAIYLVDTTLGTETNLKTNAYTFTSAIGTFNTRFKLTYKTSSSLNINNLTFDENSISVYKQNGVLNINAGKIIMKNVKVFDLAGKLILEQKAVNATSTTLKNLATGKQAVLIQITSDENKVVTKKAIN